MKVRVVVIGRDHPSGAHHLFGQGGAFLKGRNKAVFAPVPGKETSRGAAVRAHAADVLAPVFDPDIAEFEAGTGPGVKSDLAARHDRPAAGRTADHLLADAPDSAFRTMIFVVQRRIRFAVNKDAAFGRRNVAAVVPDFRAGCFRDIAFSG